MIERQHDASLVDGEGKPFSRTPKVTPATEQYLAAIYALTEERKVLIGARLAEHMRVSAPSITQTLQRLVRQGFVRLIDLGDRKEIQLTELGRQIGETATRKHRLIELWLQGQLKLSATEAHEAAHRLETGFTPELLERLYDALGRPPTCPHGNPIPGSNFEMTHDGMYLDQVSAGDTVRVVRITEEAEADLDLLSYLERHRVGPNTRLTIIAADRRSGAVTARTEFGDEIRVEQRSAALIFVRPDRDPPKDSTASASV
ncbi:MAG: metal-dependent transcriptional regulator [Dehalococcoidia bacterium]|nr:metal-dependent transcriptional regulator [Dehalococcoidia bacterium]